MRVLIACEFSGIIREAFRKLGHDSWSCDILDCDDGSKFHIKDDVLGHLNEKWDLMICHPPCTHLAVSGAKHFHRKAKEQAEALDFVKRLFEAPIDKIAIENPVSIISSRIRKPDQIVQPWMFGNEYTKTTCLWLKNLPKLQPTKIVDKGTRHVTKSGKSLPEWYNLPPSVDRWKIRSKTFQGLADAMASQWGRGDNDHT